MHQLGMFVTISTRVGFMFVFIQSLLKVDSQMRKLGMFVTISTGVGLMLVFSHSLLKVDSQMHRLGISPPPSCHGVHRNRMQKLKTHLLRTPRSKILPLNTGVGYHMAMHASPVSRDLFLELISTFPVHSSAFFSKTSPEFSPALAVANAGSCVSPQSREGHHTGCHR